MKEKSPDERAERIDALANKIITAAKADETERRRLGDEAIQRLKRFLANSSNGGTP
jgi:hypothetical protein